MVIESRRPDSVDVRADREVARSGARFATAGAWAAPPPVTQDPTVIRRILSHLGLPTEVPAARPARSPPLPVGQSCPSHPRYDDISAS